MPRFAKNCESEGHDDFPDLAEAKEEILAASGWYDEKQAGLGDEFVDEVNASIEAIKENPSAFAALETNRSKRNIQRALVKRFPYLVVFEILGEDVVVLAVAHGRQKPNYWKNRADDGD